MATGAETMLTQTAGNLLQDQVTHRCTVAGQTAALKFGDPRVMALRQALVLFGRYPMGSVTGAVGAVMPQTGRAITLEHCPQGAAGGAAGEPLGSCQVAWLRGLAAAERLFVCQAPARC